MQLSGEEGRVCDTGAVRCVQRTGATAGPAAAQRRLGLSHPPVSAPFHPHTRRVRLADRGIIPCDRRWDHHGNRERTLSLKDAAQAHRDLQARKTIGSVVLTP
jgi:hypothetical protein